MLVATSASALSLPIITINDVTPAQLVAQNHYSIEDNAFTIAFTVEDIGGHLQNAQVIRNGQTQQTYLCTGASCSFNYAAYEPVPGDYTYTLKAYADSGSNLITTTKTITITVPDDVLPNHNPVITSTPGTTATVGEYYSYRITATDADGDDLLYLYYDGPNWMNFNGNTNTVSWTPVLQQVGISHSVQLRVEDGNGGLAIQQFSIFVNPSTQNNAPIIVGDIPAQTEDEDAATWTIDLTQYESDTEDSSTDLDWSVSDYDSDLIYASITDIDADTLSIKPQQNAFGSTSLKLTLTDSEGTTAEQTITVTLTSVNDNPTIEEFSASPTSGTAPLTVNFNSLGADIEGDVTYYWAFGDGGVSILEDPTHTYDTPRTYQAALTVRDEDGAVAFETVTIKVIDPSANSVPVVHASASPSSGTAPLSVKFTSSATGGDGVISYLWDFGDGVTSNSRNPTHIYSKQGTYFAKLTVSDADGDKDTAIVRIVVSPKSFRYSSYGGGGSSRSSASYIIPDFEDEDDTTPRISLGKQASMSLVSNEITLASGETQRVDITVVNSNKLSTYTLKIDGLAGVASYFIEPASVVLAPNQELKVYAYVIADESGQYLATVSLMSEGKVVATQPLVVNVEQASSMDIITPWDIIKWIFAKLRAAFSF